MQRKMFFVLAVLSFAAGLLVWYFGHGMIRFYAGDGIAVFFLYACVSLVTPWKPATKAIIIGSIALAVECAQIFILHPGNSLQQMALGAYFDPFDLIAYALGLGVAVDIDYASAKVRSS